MASRCPLPGLILSTSQGPFSHQRMFMCFAMVDGWTCPPYLAMCKWEGSQAMRRHAAITLSLCSTQSARSFSVLLTMGGNSLLQSLHRFRMSESKATSVSLTASSLRGRLTWIDGAVRSRFTVIALRMGLPAVSCRNAKPAPHPHQVALTSLLRANAFESAGKANAGSAEFSVIVQPRVAHARVSYNFTI